MSKSLILITVLLGAGCLGDDEVPATKQRALADASAALAHMLTDDALRVELESRLAARATGDYEVLVSDLADLHLDLGVAADVVEHLQIAAPLGVDWGDAVPEVTYVPEVGHDLVYFDASGGATSRAADARPGAPVLVLGENERVNRRFETGDKAEPASLTNASLYIREIFITDAHEPWYKGDPEIFVRCTTDSDRTARVDLPYVDEVLTSYTPNVRILSNLSDADGDIDCKVWEDDGSDGNDFVGYASYSTAALNITTASSCAVDGNLDAHLGASIVKGTNTCPELYPFAICDQRCSNMQWL